MAAAQLDTDIITVQGRRIRVRVDGEAANPPVLLVHGIGRALEDWDELAERIVDRYRVIRLDVPGFGYSDRWSDEATIPSLAAGISPVLDAIGESRPVHVVGNSLGGAVSMAFLAAHPERVKTLTLICSAGFGTYVTPILKPHTFPVLGWLVSRRLTRSAALVGERVVHVDHSVITEERLGRIVDTANQPGNGDFMVEVMRGLATFGRARLRWSADLRRRAAEHVVPTLIIWGDRDRLLPASDLATALEVFPHAQSHVFANTGHMPQVERANETAALVTALFAANAE